MTKPRTQIPAETAADILFDSDNTCCVCRERGKAVQIHHLDEDPTNHTTVNLAILCLECHNQTMISGGFGRKLTCETVIRYRDEWLRRVKDRRDIADRLAVSKLVGEQQIQSVTAQNIPSESGQPSELPDLLAYIDSLPEIRKELRSKAQPGWDSSVTVRMVQASYDYIDALQGLLTVLANYYPKGHFGNKDLHKFFSEQIALRFAWHHAHVGTGGTIVNVICSGNVVADVEKMVEDIVMSSGGWDDRFDWKEWFNRWKKAGEGKIAGTISAEA